MPRRRLASRRRPSPLPGRCGGCGDALHRAAPTAAWCVHCAVRWGPVPGPWAPGLGCGGWAAAVYRGRVRRAVLQAKRGAPQAAAELLLARLPEDELPAGTTVCWIPAHPRRALLRPDAGRALAEVVASARGLPITPLLRRSPFGRRQAGRADEARRTDPARLGLRVAAREVPRSVLLVDDVRTTGTTLDRAAALLRAAGAEEISALVVAAAPRSLPPEPTPDWRAGR